MPPVRIDSAHQIGETAGAIWHFLNAHGPVPISKLVKELDQPKETVLQGLGWLAREGKIEYRPGKGNAKIVGLT